MVNNDLIRTNDCSISIDPITVFLLLMLNQKKIYFLVQWIYTVIIYYTKGINAFVFVYMKVIILIH